MILGIVAVQWRHRADEPGSSVSQSSSSARAEAKRATSPADVALKPPPGEPPEDVLLRFQKEEYDEINRVGGMKVTVSASGRQLVLRPTLHSGRKESCRPIPREPEGSYECGLDLMVTLSEDDDKPGQHGERQFVHWDGRSGEWRRGLAKDEPRARP